MTSHIPFIELGCPRILALNIGTGKGKFYHDFNVQKISKPDNVKHKLRQLCLSLDEDVVAALQFQMYCHCNAGVLATVTYAKK